MPLWSRLSSVLNVEFTRSNAIKKYLSVEQKLNNCSFIISELLRTDDAVFLNSIFIYLTFFCVNMNLKQFLFVLLIPIKKSQNSENFEKDKEKR